MSVSRAEWDAKWLEEYKRYAKQMPPGEAFNAAHRRMQLTYGFRPQGPPEPPFWLKLVAPVIGVPMKSIKAVWDWLNGRKLFLTALLSAIPVITQAFYEVWCALYDGTCPASATSMLVVSATVVSVGHKLLKVLNLSPSPEVK